MVEHLNLSAFSFYIKTIGQEGKNNYYNKSYKII